MKKDCQFYTREKFNRAELAIISCFSFRSFVYSAMIYATYAIVYDIFPASVKIFSSVKPSTIHELIELAKNNRELPVKMHVEIINFVLFINL